MLKIPASSILLLILGATLILGTGICLREFIECADAGKCMWLSDFSIVYSPARALVEGDLSGIYNVKIIEDWVAGDTSVVFHPTLYPPYSLFLFYPLGLLAPIPAAIVWFSAQVLLLACVVNMRGTREFFPNISGLYIGVFLLPFCGLTLIAGQVGILCAALFLLVIVWRKTHPVLAGIAFSLLCFKPQMAFALAVLLLSEKNRRALITILLCLGIAILLSMLLWGITLWSDYLKTSILSALIMGTALPRYVQNASSFFMAIRMMGGSITAAKYLQLSLTCMVGVTLWWALRHTGNDRQKLALLAPATFLLSPYSFVYDTVLLAPLCVLLAAQIILDKGSTIIWALLVMLAFLPIVAIKLHGLLHVPYAVITILFAYGFALQQVFHSTLHGTVDAKNILT